ncbi:MAG: geranylgeranylglycerol-phosphate geranylgeranyltransferase [Breznakibacter sp.]|nr:geranylgeranylglycerol-phosphate geranylgeranyltransferase [Breznakibacter sp.]
MEFLRLVRFKNLVIIVLLQYLLRYAFILPILERFRITPILTEFRFALMSLATVLLAASGYVINDYFDVKIDHVNRPSKVLIGKVYSRRTALFLHIVFTLSGVLLGLFLAYVARKESYVVMYLSIPIILWYYSTTFKKQILIGNILIAFLSALVAYLVVSLEFAMLVRVYGESILSSPACSIAWFWTSALAFFAFISTLGREIVKDMEDVKGDLRGGCKTLPIEVGLKNSKIIVTLLNITLLGAIWFGVNEIDTLGENLNFVYILASILSLFILILMIQLFFAKEQKSFKRCSTLSKLVMIVGILFFAAIGYFMFRV